MGDIMKFKGYIIAILMVLTILTCIAFADQPVPAVPETQGLGTSTGADVVGMATETDTGAWTLTLANNTATLLHQVTLAVGLYDATPSEQAQLIAAGGSLIGTPAVGGNLHVTQMTVPDPLMNVAIVDAPSETWGQLIATLIINPQASLSDINSGVPTGIHTGVLAPGQIQYTTAYDANIVAQAGHTVLVKSMNINTGNKVAATQSNLNANTLLTYVATDDGGNVVGSENLLIEGAGNSTKASDRMLCPFASIPIDEIPAYCNIVQTGSSFDLTVGTVKTSANDRFVGTDATVPVALNYNIAVSPYSTTDGSIPAIGSVSAYIKAHIQEAHTNTSKAEDLQYAETSTASGNIQQFIKDMHYQSGKSLLP